MSQRAGEAAELGFKAHPHMLRHACGFALANKGHDTRALQAYLGHKNIQQHGSIHRAVTRSVQGFLALNAEARHENAAQVRRTDMPSRGLAKNPRGGDELRARLPQIQNHGGVQQREINTAHD